MVWLTTPGALFGWTIRRRADNESWRKEPKIKRSTVRTRVVVVVLALMALSAVPAASADTKADTGTVVATVRYRDSGGDLQPLADVEVFLWDGAVHYLCTDADGKATFLGVEAGVDLIAATAPAVSEMGCTNSEFLNPETGERMFAVFWKNHHGALEFDNFQVGAGEQKSIKFTARTPSDQTTVCGGMLTTIVGTNGLDVIQGTTGDDVIDGRGGNDVIYGKGGHDIICGGSGRDRLYGGPGDDWLLGEAGRDRLFGEAGDDVLHGGLLADRCRTGELLFSCES